jgi:hypothetical protein
MSTVTCCRPHTKLGVANNSQQVFNALLHRVRHLSGVSSRVVRAVFKPSENGASAHNQLRTAPPLPAIQRRSERWHTATSQREERSGATLRRNAALGEHGMGARGFSRRARRRRVRVAHQLHAAEIRHGHSVHLRLGEVQRRHRHGRAAHASAGDRRRHPAGEPRSTCRRMNSCGICRTEARRRTELSQRSSLEKMERMPVAS